MTTHHDVMHDPLVAQHAPLIAQATATVADPQVRHRGTFGGALAHADPAGDLGAVALALGLRVRRSPGRAGRATDRGGDFFLDYLTTALAADEVLTAIRVPKLGDGLVVALREVQPGRPGVVDRRGGRGGAPRQRIDRRGPDRADQHGLDAAAGGGGRAGAGRGRCLGGGDCVPPPSTPPRARTRRQDLSGQADYREHLARVLTKRAVVTAAGVH